MTNLIDVLTPRIYWGMLIVLQTAMAIELVLLLFEQQWLNATLVLGSIGLTMAPAMLTPRLYVRIPAEFQLLAIGFVFASLFLGESLSYYDRFLGGTLHSTPVRGLLLGVFGFLLVLPDPLGPRNPNTIPRGTSNERPSTALRVPNSRVRFSASIAGRLSD